MFPDMFLSNSLYPDQAARFVRPVLGLNCFTLIMLFLKDFLKKLILNKISRQQKGIQKIPSMVRYCINNVYVYGYYIELDG